MRGSDWALLALLALVFTPALLTMAEVWSSVDHYSHGFFIPLFSAAAFHASRKWLGPAGRDRRGEALIAAALLVYAAGLLAGSATLQGFAFVGAVAGAVLRLWGPAGLRRLAFPVGFLIFMVPLPNSLITPLILWLQLVVTSLSVEVLQLFGVEVARVGNVLTLPNGEQLFVAEACSGITSLITLLPLGVLIAHFMERGWPRRLLIVAAVVPVAMLGNLLRVVLTSIAALHLGADIALGTLHEIAGLATFAMACLMLLGLVSLLRSRTESQAPS